MIGIWGETVAEGAIAGADALNQPFFHQELQDTIHCHPINLMALVQFIDNLLRTRRMRPIANDFQNAQSIYRVT